MILTAQLFALLTSLTFSTSDTVTRYGIRTSTPITAILTWAFVTILLYGPAGALSFGEYANPRGLFFLVCAGVSSPGLAGIFFYQSMQQIGLSRTSCFTASSPLVMVLLAVLILGERPRPLIYVGTLLIVVGMMVLALERRQSAGGDADQPFWRHYGLAALATLMFGASALLRKTGITLVPSMSVALSATAVGMFLATLLANPLISADNRIRWTRQSVGYFAASGVLNTVAHFCLFAALSRAPVSLVVPLAYVTPLFAMGYSWLLFREMERLNFRLVIGGVLIIAGAVIVTISRA